MKRQPKREDELREASNHLCYEVYMLRETTELLASGQFKETPLSNALIESFTIHVRALIDFLYGEENVRSSDVIAQDFFAAPDEWEGIRPAPPEPLEKARGRVNKEIVHLTYDRQLVRPELKGWDFRSLAEAILSVVNAFLARVRPNLLGERWRPSAGEVSPPSVSPPTPGGVTDASTPGIGWSRHATTRTDSQVAHG